MIETFTVKQALQLTDFKTSYMLDYLHRTGIVRPSRSATPGRGRRRLYTFRDLVLLRSVNHLLRRGLPVRKLKLAIVTMRKKFRDIPLNGRVGADRYVLTDGTSVYLVDGEAKIFDLAQEGQMAFIFMLDVETIRNEVTKEIAKLRA